MQKRKIHWVIWWMTLKLVKRGDDYNELPGDEGRWMAWRWIIWRWVEMSDMKINYLEINKLKISHLEFSGDEWYEDELPGDEYLEISGDEWLEDEWPGDECTWRWAEMSDLGWIWPGRKAVTSLRASHLARSSLSGGIITQVGNLCLIIVCTKCT